MRPKGETGASGRAVPARRSDSCYTCRFWVGHGFRERGPKGTCRRYPPAVTPRHPDGAFPITDAGTWCGEWQRATGRGQETEPPAATQTI